MTSFDIVTHVFAESIVQAGRAGVIMGSLQITQHVVPKQVDYDDIRKFI
jgi:hypothetical protein